MSDKNKGTGNGLRFRTEVPEGHLRQLIEKSHAHTARVNATRVKYPNPDTLHLLTDRKIEKLGFLGHDLGELLNLEPLEARGGRRRRRQPQQQPKGRGGKSGGGRSGGGRSGGGKTLPNAQTVLAEVQKSLAANGIKPVTNTGDAVTIEWNMEFLDETKARYFAATYKAIFECGDLAYLAEVSAKGVAELAKITGYLGYCSVENNRGQAVGFLVNPNRYEVISVDTWHEIGTVQGIPDLRPAFVLVLKDKITGHKTRRVVNHFKSMRGGPAVTQPVRYQQFQKVAARLGTPVAGCKPQVGKYQLLQMFKNVNVGRGLSDHGVLFVTEHIPTGVTPVDGMSVIAGDFNDFLDKSTSVTAPLTGAGYPLVFPNDNTSTQSMGGRLDGFFRDLPSGTCKSASPSSGPFADNSGDSAAVTQ